MPYADVPLYEVVFERMRLLGIQSGKTRVRDVRRRIADPLEIERYDAEYALCGTDDEPLEVTVPMWARLKAAKRALEERSREPA